MKGVAEDMEVAAAREGERESLQSGFEVLRTEGLDGLTDRIRK